MNLSALSNDVLWDKVGSLIQVGRRIDVVLLHHLSETDKRRLYAERGYSNMWDMLKRGFKLGNAWAQRRLDTIHLMRAYPEVVAKIEDGSLSMSVASVASVASMAYRCFRDNALKPEVKAQLLQNLENKSEREAEKETRKLVPKALPAETDKPLDAENSLLTIVVDDETREALKKLKAYFSHSHPNMSTAELLKILVRDGIKKYDKAREPQRKRSEVPVAEPKTDSEPTAETKRAMWKRDGGQCTYVDKKTDVRCTSTHFLQGDHIVSRAIGGTNELSNMRLRCQTHNLLHAYQVFGKKKMDRYVRN